MDQNAIQPSNPLAINNANLPGNPAANNANPPVNNVRQQDNNDNQPCSERGNDGDQGRPKRDLCDELCELHQNHDIRTDLNKHHNEHDEHEVRRYSEYDRDYDAPIPNRIAARDDQRRQEDEMRRCADYDSAYGTPEGACDPPRHDYDYKDAYNSPRREYDYEDAYYLPRRNYGGRGRVPPDQYYLDDDYNNDMAIDGFAACTLRLQALHWPPTFKPAINEKHDGRSNPIIWFGLRRTTP